MPKRRDVLAGLAATAFLPSKGWASVGKPVAISAAKRSDGQHILVGLSARGSLVFQVPLPDRGHAAAAHPSDAEVVAISRRPGTFALVINCLEGKAKQRLDAPKGHHFYGHATFSRDGRYLFTTENLYETGEGRIGVWERQQGFSRVGDFSSGGIGPHEIILLPNGDLAVANGGIRTHPNSGRDKLNLLSMRSNLSIMSISGTLKDQTELPPSMRLNSLRHIAALPDGTIGFGCQWQGDVFETPALFGTYSGKGGLHFEDVDETQLRSLKGYIGSVAAVGADAFVATSPRGHAALLFGLKDHAAQNYRAHDVCGVTTSAQGVTLLTNGLGQVFSTNTRALSQLAAHNLAFDNHLIAVP
ncbi:MAG: DUF1513 domain-containing protein [Pseudomonadota bacterium]